jgi:hypothetical protein
MIRDGFDFVGQLMAFGVGGFAACDCGEARFTNSHLKFTQQQVFGFKTVDEFAELVEQEVVVLLAGQPDFDFLLGTNGSGVVDEDRK